VRLLGDDERVSAKIGQRLIELAASEPDPIVRCQLACTAKRLPPAYGLKIAQMILLRNLDAQDPYLPLLLWWAVEHHAIAASHDLLAWITSAEATNAPMVREVILDRLMRRYASERTSLGYDACARLLACATSDRQRSALLAALDAGIQDSHGIVNSKPLGTLFANLAAADVKPQRRAQPRARTSPILEKQLQQLWNDDTNDINLIRLMARLGSPKAAKRALELVINGDTTVDRVALIQILGQTGSPASLAPLLKLASAADGDEPPEAVRLEALATLQTFNQAEVATGLLAGYPRASGRVRARICEVLLSRKGWAFQLLRAIDQGKIAATDISADQLRLVALHEDIHLNDLVRKHWGTIQAGTPEEKLAEMRRLSNDLRAAAGDPAAGRAIFVKHCATCHRLAGEGNLVGPDLTHANRGDRDYLLVSIVDPSAIIRKEYLSYNVQTTDGRLLTGLIADQSAGSITLLGAKNERTVIPRQAIESMRESPVSLMPDNLLKDLKPQEVRDLFSYLHSAKP
jgi:putative heme-binding domain-containing protein